MGNSGYQLHKACPDLKSRYETCQSKYFDELYNPEKSGDSVKQACRDEWEDYKACVDKVWEEKVREYENRKGIAKDTNTTNTSSTDQRKT